MSKGSGEASNVDVVSKRAPARGEFPVEASSWPLVGRERELARVSRAIARRDLAGLVLAGPAGVGKSRFAAECATLGARAGFHCQRVLATRAAATVPLGALAPLLDDAQAPVGPRRDLLRWVVDAVTVHDRPVLLVVDDAHLLDDASASVLHQLVEREGAFVVLTIRTGETPPHTVSAFLEAATTEQLELGPLARPDVDRLLSAVLGGAIDGATRRDLWDASHGNPLFIHQLVLGALDAGILTAENGVWRLTREFTTTPRLIELVEARLAGLASRERSMLELVALGEPLDVALVERLGVDRDQLRAFEARGLARVLTEGGQRQVRLAHPMHGEVLRHCMTAVSRLVANRRLADAVDLATASEDDVLRLAVWRLEGGGDLDSALTLAAARRAYFAHDCVLAERLARAARDGGAGLPAALLLAQILAQLGRHTDRHNLLASSQAQASTAEERAMVAMELSLTLFWGLSRGDDAHRVLQTAEAELPAGAAQDEVIAQRATLELLMGRFHDAIDSARPLLAGDRADRAAVTAAIAAAPALAVCGRCDEAIAVADRALVAQLALGDQEVMSEAGIHLVARTLALGESGRLAEAEACAAAYYEAAVASRVLAGQAWFALMRGRVGLVTGKLAGAGTWFRQGAAAYAELGEDGPRRWCLGGRVVAAAQQGDAAEAAAALAELDGVRPTPMAMMEPDLIRARAWEASVRGFPAAAHDLLLQAAAHADGSGAHALAVLAWHDVARLGWPDEAAPALDRLAACVDGDLASCRSAHAAALVRQDPDALAASADRFEANGATLLAAEAAAAAAAAYRNHRQARNAERWAQRACRLAKSCEGARTPALALMGTTGTITRREHEVAALAGSGLSSDEIGRRLKVTRRTVESHLQQTYIKLGVSSRAELADLLSPDDAFG